MRIAIIDPSLWTLPYDDALARGLRALGHEVSLYGRPGGGEEDGAGTVEVVPAFYPLTRGETGSGPLKPLRQGMKGLEHIAAMARLPGLLRRGGAPAVIHFQWLPLPFLDRHLVRRLAGTAPLVLTLHDSTPFNGNPPSVLTRIGMAECYAAFDALIVHTEAARQGLLHQGVSAEKVAVVPHGLFGPVPGGSDVAAPKASAAVAPSTLLLFGKIKPYKGADLLIRAFGRLPPALRTRARLRIVGKPYLDIGQLAALARECGVEGAVSIEPGFVAEAEIPSLFGRDVVSVFPYRAVDASGVLALAIAHGRPIVASRIGAFAELLQDGRHGLLVPPGDVEALAGALARMLEDAPFAAGCAANTRALAAVIPGWDEIGRQTLAVYERATTAWQQRARGGPARVPPARRAGPGVLSDERP